MTWYNRGKDGKGLSSTADFAALAISDPLGNTPCIGGYQGATQIISWSLDQDGWLQSHSNIDQTRHQNLFFPVLGAADGNNIQACLPPGLDHLGIEANRVFTMKLEPV
ncbi:hypothetical protein M407DRAFT_240895 [Tulasnella calospora MUT 4182]|uniref:Uncharacterized protein n=1 Tax=Tulasnella calospora MUT 4182 TaxID=1051891 RepID=A0A0C3QVN7_9AGAM|nr:hypothetical protein M407DRAFT_240895 [Tulasnella calospora MUT 4182]